MEIFNTISENGDSILAAVGKIIAVASLVAAVTKTPKGGRLKAVYKIIDVLALNVGKAKDK